MIRLMKDLPDNALGVLANGKISGADYETILIPALEEKLKINTEIRLLYHIENDFTGFDFSAMWDDAKLGMKYSSKFERIALVSDHEMINAFVKFFGHMITSEIRIYKEAELELAKEWITEKRLIENGHLSV
jgi:hypothetical protein